ncbi:MAG: antitoxin VapB family protein, partial [Chthoniobacterales bacterium]
MKTITLTDEAYHRLKSWKTEPSESFSKVVLKAVPKRGTAADM